MKLTSHSFLLLWPTGLLRIRPLLNPRRRPRCRTRPRRPRSVATDLLHDVARGHLLLGGLAVDLLLHVRALRVQPELEEVTQLTLLGEHGDERGDELVVVVRAAAVVDAVLLPLLVLLADVRLAGVDLEVDVAQQRQEVLGRELLRLVELLLLGIKILDLGHLFLRLALACLVLGGDLLGALGVIVADEEGVGLEGRARLVIKYPVINVLVAGRRGSVVRDTACY